MSALKATAVVVIIVLVGIAFIFISGANPVPQVSFTNIKDQSQINLYNSENTYQLNKPILINFWATDCPSCLAEMPHLKELYHDYKDKGFMIIGVAMQYDKPNAVANMAKNKQLDYIISYDQQGNIAKAFNQVRLTPTSFLIDNKGNIIYQKIGGLDMEIIRQKLNQLL